VKQPFVHSCLETLKFSDGRHKNSEGRMILIRIRSISCPL